MKTIFIALGMALILFVYGYICSTVGHDQDHHEGGASRINHYSVNAIVIFNG